MKIILSRKGIDGGIGKKPSPLIKDSRGELRPVSIPIFDEFSNVTSEQVTLSGNKLSELISSLEINQDGLPFIHLDPDLDDKSIPRKTGWKALFGQSGAALGQLNKHKIGNEDLFLFFGWFKQIEQENGIFRYKKDAPDIHLFYGWLQVGEVWNVQGKTFKELEANYPWAHSHPHFGKKDGLGHGSIYVAREFLQLDGQPEKMLPGSGIFSRSTSQSQLTLENHGRSIWSLPSFFHKIGKPWLSYHTNENRWTSDSNGWVLKTVGRGQEFIFSSDENQKTISDWVFNLIQNHR